MDEKVKVATKEPEAKRENKSSLMKKSGPSQSISSPVEQIMFLQRTIGNQAVGGLIKSGALQAKLRIGQPDDIYEQEADRMAEQVMKMPEPQILEVENSGITSVNPVQRQCPRCTKKPGKEEEVLQAKEEVDKTSEVTSEVENSISALCGGGQPLPESVRAFYEPRFGHDFSGVRVHTDAKAGDAARAVNAKAFTVGKDVVFGVGEYAHGESTGRRLMAHELMHVIQQEGKPSQRGVQVVSANSISSPALQRKDNEDIKTIEWKVGVEMAEKAANNPRTKGIAEGYYKELIVRAAQKVTAPSPLVDKKPATGNIIWNWTKTGEYAATTDPTKVDKTPDDYWNWLTFNPGVVQKEEAFTISALLHELDHAAHARALYDEWKKAKSKKKTWANFYIDHYTNWTEKEIKIKKSGLVGTLAGLPEKISPSTIEFRAYVNQFVNYFHKFSADKQEFLARAVILFYPLKIQMVEAEIRDPALDLSKSRQQILDYFRSPPVKDKAQQEIIKVRVASELKSALYLFRPSDDYTQIAADFKDILDYPVDSDERKEALKNYKPEAL